MPDSHARLTAVAAALGTVLAGLWLRASVGGALAKDGGDALYTVLLWTLVLLVAPRLRPVTAAGIALGLSWIVEFCQLSPILAELSARSEAARLVLGSTFNAPDLLWYAVGAGGCLAVHSVWRARRVGVPRSG